MSIFEVAKELKKVGWPDNQIRKELRQTVNAYGEFPTCSAVEEAIGAANNSLKATSLPDREREQGVDGREAP